MKIKNYLILTLLSLNILTCSSSPIMTVTERAEGSADTATILDAAANGQLLHTFAGHTPIYSVASFSPDGSQVVETAGAPHLPPQRRKRATADSYAAQIAQGQAEISREALEAEHLAQINLHRGRLILSQFAPPNPTSQYQLQRAYELFTLAAYQSMSNETKAKAFYWLGQAKLKGWGTSPNNEHAQLFLQLAESTPHEFQYRAKHYLAQLLLKKQRVDDALNLFQQAIDQTEEAEVQTMAKHATAQLYLHGAGVPQNLKLASQYIRDIQQAETFQDQAGKREIRRLLTEVIAKHEEQSGAAGAGAGAVSSTSSESDHDADSEDSASDWSTSDDSSYDSAEQEILARRRKELEETRAGIIQSLRNIARIKEIAEAMQDSPKRTQALAECEREEQNQQDALVTLQLAERILDLAEACPKP